jgi:hypothetical protein
MCVSGDFDLEDDPPEFSDVIKPFVTHNARGANHVVTTTTIVPKSSEIVIPKKRHISSVITATTAAKSSPSRPQKRHKTRSCSNTSVITVAIAAKPIPSSSKKRYKTRSASSTVGLGRRVTYSKGFAHKHASILVNVYSCPRCHYKLTPVPLRRCLIPNSISNARLKCPSCFAIVFCSSSKDENTIDLVSSSDSDDEKQEKSNAVQKKKKTDVLHHIPEVGDLRKGDAVFFRRPLKKKKGSFLKTFWPGWLRVDPTIIGGNTFFSVTEFRSDTPDGHYNLPTIDAQGQVVVKFRLADTLMDSVKACQVKRWKFRINERDKGRVLEVTNETNGDEKEVMVDLQHTQMTRKDFRTLAEGQLVNDDCLFNFLLLCVNQHRNRNIIHVFNTYFFTQLTSGWNGDRTSKSKRPKFNYYNVRRWTRTFNIFSKKHVFIPIHLRAECHWVLVAINFYKKCMSFYDALSGSAIVIINMVKKWVNLELLRKQVFKKIPSNYWRKWQIKVNESESQENGHDCGIFVAMNCWCLMNNVPTRCNAAQKNILMFRMYMALCLMQKTALRAT